MSAALVESGAEVAALIEVLHATDRRLEELLAGEVDSVTSKDGRTTLLRRAQEHLRHSENARQAAILSALPAHIALLDTQGVIVSVNNAWRQFATANALRSAGHAVGLNYLAICEQALGTDSGEAEPVAAGIRSVLDGEAKTFSIRYPCHSATEQRWFQLMVTPLADDHMRGVVVMHLNVTDRVLVEEEQRLTQQLLNNIVDNIPTAVQLKLVEDSFRIQLWNKAAEALYGVPREAAIGHTVHDLWPTADADGMHAADLELLAGGENQDFPDRCVPTKARGTIRAHMRKVVLHDTGGKPSHVLVIADDITVQKRAEAALRESEAEFRTLAEAMPQIVWVAQADGAAGYFNAQWMEYTGLSLDESLGRTWKMALHADDRQHATDCWQQARATQRIFSVESRIRRADGVYRWWLIRAVPKEGAAGTPLKWIGTCTDIDELKQAQLEITRVNDALRHRQQDLEQLAVRLKEGQSQLIAAQALAKIGSWSTDLATGVVAWSGETHRIFGTDPATFHPTHQLILDLIHPDDRMAAKEAFQRSIGDRSIGTIQHRVLLSSGVLKSVEERWQVFDDAQGKPVRAAGTCQDITERKRDQDALRDLNIELEARVLARTSELKSAHDEARTANKAKSAFLAAMSHEIRTPMNGVIGMIEVLHQTSLKGHQVEILDVIRESAFALLQIIEDILDFSKIEAGKLTLENEPLELAEMVEKTCGMLDHLAVKQGVRMTVFIDPAVPRVLSGDAGRLRQVLVNLAGNAIKFSGGREQPGQVSVRVLLAQRHAQTVTIEMVVADNGIGIEGAALARLFTPFSQADASTTRRFGGTGLGLAICSMLVRLMDGTITVQSVPGGGSTFTVRLRLAALDGAGQAQEAQALVRGLRCRIVGLDVPLGEDIAATLSHAQVAIERSPDLAAAARVRPSGPEVWLILPGVTVADAAQLRAMRAGRPDAETRFIVLGWGKRRRPRVEAADLVFLDANTLLRRTLIRSLALVAGRVQEQSTVDEQDQDEPAQAPTRQDAQLQGRLILVAEDNETNRIVILRQLALIGFAAQIAVDGREALELWRTGDFALLLTDLHMPQMDGYALTEAIRAEEVAGRRFPIIALTANALRDEERHCLAAGMDAYLTKPVRVAQLKASIEKWIGPCAQPAASIKGEEPLEAKVPAVDLRILIALVGDDPAVINEVLDAFRATIALSAMVLDQANLPGSGQAVADAAHKLKSAARSIGALQLGELCAQMEQVAQARRSGELTALIPLLHAESQTVLRFLDAR